MLFLLVASLVFAVLAILAPVVIFLVEKSAWPTTYPFLRLGAASRSRL